MTNSVILITALASFVSGSVKIREMKRQHLDMTDKRWLVGKYTRLFMLFSLYTHFYLHISFQSIVYLSVILLPPAFSKKSGGTLFSAFRSRYAWFRICACNSEIFCHFFRSLTKTFESPKTTEREGLVAMVEWLERLGYGAESRRKA